MSGVMYLCSGRSFRSPTPMRKIVSIKRCWEELGFAVDLVCGGDVPGWIQNRNGIAKDAPPAGEAMEGLLPTWVTHSISEWRDWRHDQALYELLSEKRSRKPWDIVWERSSRLHWAGLKLAKQLDVPYVLEWKDHLIPYGRSLFHGLAERVERMKEQGASVIVVESDVLKAALARQVRGKVKIIVAHNAVDPEEFRASDEGRRKFRRLWGVADDEVVVGYMGSYAFYHDCMTLVNAAKHVFSKTASNIRFVMIGNGKQYEETAALAKKERLYGSAILMLPGVPLQDASAALCGFDIAVLPGSTDIICPIKVLEFMAAETPAVVPDYGCNREVIEDGVTGLLFAPRSAADLASKVLLLAGDPVLRQNMGRRARKQAIGRFGWRQTWGEALKAVVADPCAKPGESSTRGNGGVGTRIRAAVSPEPQEGHNLPSLGSPQYDRGGEYADKPPRP